MEEERTEKNKSLLKRLKGGMKKGLKWDKDLIKSYYKNSYKPALKKTGKAGEKGLKYAWKGLDKVGKKLFSTNRRGATENAVKKYNKDKEEAKKANK